MQAVSFCNSLSGMPSSVHFYCQKTNISARFHCFGNNGLKNGRYFSFVFRVIKNQLFRKIVKTVHLTEQLFKLTVLKITKTFFWYSIDKNVLN